MDEEQARYLRVNRPVMACGHVSNGLYTTDEGEKIAVCLDCTKKGDPKKAKEVVDLKGRTAVCVVCKNVALSSPDLFSFFYNASKPYDDFYDGCQG